MITGYGKNDFTDLYACLKTKDDVKGYLEHEIEPIFYFYAKDYQDFNTTKEIQSGASLRNIDNLVIMTPVMNDFEDGYYVVDQKTKKYWRIESHVVADDGRMKRYSMNPRKYTILTLRG